MNIKRQSFLQKMANKNWEIKSPIKYSNSSFEDNFKKASRQSENIIYDLRRLTVSDEKLYINKILQNKNRRRIKTLLIISRDGNLLTIKGKFDIIKP